MSATQSRIVLSLRPDRAPGRVTTCSLSIYLDGAAAWPVHGEDVRLDIQIDDLLSHLTDFWMPLMVRQAYPIDVLPGRPSELRREAERRWTGLPAAAIEAEEDAVLHFGEAHDLSRAFAGIYGLPPFWMLRCGDDFILETAERLWRLPFDDVRRALAAAGDWVCERLGQADPARWDTAISAWRERDRGDRTAPPAWAAGRDPAWAAD